MEKYRALATVVAIQIYDGNRKGIEGLPKWFAALVEEELEKYKAKIEEIRKEVGLA